MLTAKLNGLIGRMLWNFWWSIVQKDAQLQGLHTNWTAQQHDEKPFQARKGNQDKSKCYFATS